MLALRKVPPHGHAEPTGHTASQLHGDKKRWVLSKAFRAIGLPVLLLSVDHLIDRENGHGLPRGNCSSKYRYLGINRPQAVGIA